MREDLIMKDLVIDVTADIAFSTAELRKKYGLSLADSIIAATSNQRIMHHR